MNPPSQNGCKDPKGLGQLIAQFCDLLNLADTGLSLPTVETELVWIPVSEAYEARYEAAKILKVKEQIAGFSGEESAVTDALVDRLQEAHGRIVVFAEYIPLLGHVASALRKAGGEAYVVYGDTPRKERVESLAAWHGSNDAVLLGSKVLEVGVNLQASGHLFSLGASWNPAREIQREGRIRRIGSVFDTVRHTYLLADLKLERTRWRTTQKKAESGEQIMACALESQNLTF